MSTPSKAPLSALWSADAQGLCIASQELPGGLLPVMKGITLGAWLGAVQADDDAQLALELASALDSLTAFDLEVPIRCLDGTTRRVIFSGLPDYPAEQAPARYNGFIIDVTEQRKALEDALRVAAEYRLLVENSTDLIAHCDVEGRYVSVSPSYSRMIGYPLQEIIGQPVLDFLHPDDRAPSQAALAQLFAGGVLPDVIEVRKQHRDGHYVSLGTKACGVSDPCTGHSIGAVLVSRDISRDQQRRQHLERLASRDPLTGLPNRMSISDHIKRLLSQPDDHAHTALLFIDLNGFKAVNDSKGHAAGDALLLQVSQRLADCMRAGDAIGRLGGDEFVVASRCHDHAAAAAIAQRLLDSLAHPFTLQGLEVQIGAAIGISLARPGTTSVEALFETADRAMYEAKARRDGSYQFFAPASAPPA